MAVVASFTYSPDYLIPPSTVVTFTDTSTGGPDRWYWDFGDGEFSDEQHPAHTFTGDVLDTFDVTLKSWVAGTETLISRSGLFKATNTNGGSHPDSNQGAFDLYVSWGYGSNTPVVGSFMSHQNDPDPEAAGYKYVGSFFQFNINIGALGTNNVAILLKAKRLDYDVTLNRSIGIQAGHVNAYIGGEIRAVIPGTGAFDTWYVAADITDLAGAGSKLVQCSPEPVSILPASYIVSQGFPPFDRTGIIADIALWILDSDTLENQDETQQELVFGVPPIADFTGSPLTGANPLEVQFENLSTEAIGLPTTYSWLKKLSGSEDAFVEFSTEENPLEEFNKG